ncbi:MAG: hypothetical protein R2784_16305 [Saprospiraceae bacterium]
MKIALADDEALFRKGIALLLKNAGEYTIEFEASNGRELLQNLESRESLPRPGFDGFKHAGNEWHRNR